MNEGKVWNTREPLMAASVPVRAPSSRCLPPSWQLSVQAGTHTLHWTDPLAAVKLMHFDPPPSLHCTLLHCTALQYTVPHCIALTLHYTTLHLHCTIQHYICTVLHSLSLHCPPRHPSCTTCCPQILVEPGPKFRATIRRISPRFTQQNFGSSCILIDRDWAALLLMKPSSTCQCCSMRVLTSPWLYGLIWSDLNDHYTTCNYSTILSLMKKSSYGQHSALLYVCDSGVPFLYHDLSQNHGCCQYHESMSIPRVFANTMSESMSIP